MNRIELIQRLIKKRNFRTYLEIGVLFGKVFFTVKCKRKIAVDPAFKFDWKYKLDEYLNNPVNYKSQYFDKNSDDFFKVDANRILKKGELDVVLVDGMHEFDQALDDVLNSLEFLSPEGVIIMHDCNPQNQEEASSFNEWGAREFKGNWLGDVWKCIPYLIENRPDLNVFVADCDFGLGIVTKKNENNISLKDANREKYETLNYTQLAENRATVLNLKSPSYLSDYFFNRV